MLREGCFVTLKLNCCSGFPIIVQVNVWSECQSEFKQIMHEYSSSGYKCITSYDINKTAKYKKKKKRQKNVAKTLLNGLMA